MIENGIVTHLTILVQMSDMLGGAHHGHFIAIDLLQSVDLIGTTWSCQCADQKTLICVAKEEAH